MLRSAARRLGAAAAADARARRSSRASSDPPSPPPALPARGARTHGTRAGPSTIPFELGAVRHDWTTAEVELLYDRPLLDLVFDAARVHRSFHDPRQVQQCTLLSIKTGGCPEAMQLLRAELVVERHH